MTTATTSRPRRVTVIAGLMAVALAIVVLFIVGRLTTDIPNLRPGTVPDEPFARNYVAHPWPAYLHILPGLVYLLGAPLQLSARFRRRHLLGLTTNVAIGEWWLRRGPKRPSVTSGSTD